MAGNRVGRYGLADARHRAGSSDDRRRSCRVRRGVLLQLSPRGGEMTCEIRGSRVILKGEAVTFINDDSVTHNITVPKLDVNGGVDEPGQETEIKFE